MFRERLYKPDQSLLKLYKSDKQSFIKVISMNVLRTSGVEVDDLRTFSPKGTVNLEKMSENIIRAKNKIFELAICNDWQWFFTGTLNSRKYDRSDLDKFHKDLTQFIRNYNKKHSLAIKFLLIPELHSDKKSWHIHGLLNGLPIEHLTAFEIGDKMSRILAEKVKKGDKIYNWIDYMERFGFCDLEAIKNVEATSKYITKYISKSLFNSVTKLNAHLYYCSRGLKRAETIKKGYMSPLDIEPTFRNEYCSVFWLPYTEKLFNKISQNFIK